MNRAALTPLLLGIGVVLPGCASILARSLRPDEAPYVGTRSGYEELTGPNREVSERVFFGLDLPLSAALDTLLLPWDLWAMPSREPPAESPDTPPEPADDAPPPPR